MFIEGRAERSGAEGVTSKARSKSLTEINSSLFLSTIKYFVVATIFFVSTTISDQSRLANPSELSVRKITGLWQKHHSCLIMSDKRTALYKKSNSPLEKKAFSFFHERTAHFSETQSPFLREVFSKWQRFENQRDERKSSCRRVAI